MSKLKLMTIVGTRPEIIRLSAVIKKCDVYFDQLLVHTGQNYDYTLNQIFLLSSVPMFSPTPKICFFASIKSSLRYSIVMDSCGCTSEKRCTWDNYAQMRIILNI